MTDTRKVQLQAEMDATGVKKGSAEGKAAVHDMTTAVIADANKAGEALGGMGKSSEKSAKEIERNTKSLVGSIERATAAMKAGERGSASYFEALAAQRGVSGDALKPYLEQLRQAEVAQKTAVGSLDKMGVSAKQTAAALRGVPAQFTDIFTSLQGGQAPLTVLLQQGGQLKDMFGGVGNAARAMGGYVLGLINPFTVAAAAVGTLGFAWNAGRKESDAYARALITTGNAAGATANQLAEMAGSIGRLGGPTQGRAAEVIAAMASSAQVGAANIQRFTAAALEMERAGGAAAEKTAEQFAALGKSPLDASVKLNESMNFLTRSTYEQIKALEDQGRMTEAAAAAQSAYADALESRAPQMEAALGLVERGWRRVADGAKAAWDTILDVGRANSVDQQIAEFAAQADRLRLAIANRGIASPSQVLAAIGGKSFADQARDLDAVVAKLRESKQLSEGVATAQAEQAKQVKALADYRKDELQFLTKSEQANKAITKAIVEGVAAGERMEAIQRRVAVIREKYTDKGAAGSQARELEAQADLLAKLSGLTTTYNNDIQRLNTARESGRLTQEQYNDAVQDLVALQPFAVKAAKEEADALKAQAKAAADAAKAYEQYVASLGRTEEAEQKSTQTLRDQLIAMTAGKDVLAQIVILREENNLALAEEKVLSASSSEEYARLAAIADELREQLNIRRQIAAAAAGADAEEANRKAAESATREWDRAADQIGQSLTDALMEGGKSAAEYIKGLFRTMVLRPIIQAAVQPYANAISGLLGQQAGGAGQYVQGASTLNSLYGYGQAGYGYLAQNGYFGGSAAYTAAADSALATSGNYYAGSAAAGSSTAGGASMASYAGWAALAVAAAIQAQKDYDMGFDRGSASRSGTALGAASALTADLLSRLGINDEWADIISGATLTARLFGRGAAQITGSGVQGSFGGGDFAGQAYADVYEKGGLFRSGKAYQDLSALPDDINRFLDDAAKAVRDKAGEFGAALGLPVEALDAITTQIKLNLGDELGNNEQDIKDALAAYGDALVAGWAEALKPVAIYGESTIQTVERVGAAIQATNEVLGLLEVPLLDASVAGGQAAAALADSFGGLDKLQAASAAYYQEFFTEEERKANALEALTETLGGVGLALPDSREAFRDLVSGLDLTTEAGREQFATLMSVAGAYAELNPALEETAAAVDKMAEAFASAMQGLADDAASLEVQLLRAGGNTSGARALERSQFLAGVGEVSPEQLGAIAAAYDYNQALRDQITALEDAATAAEQAAQRTAEVDAERAGLERQLLQAQGDTAAIRAIERAALDETNRSIYDRITALQDEATAAEQAARAEQEAARLEQAAAAERRTLDAAATAQARRVLSPQAYEQFQLAKISDKSGVDVETLIGLTRQQVIDLTVAFVQSGEAGTDAKLAMIEAASALLDIKDAALTTARDLRAAELQTELDGIARVFGDLSVVAEGTQTLSDAYRENRDAIADLESGLDSLLGVIEPTIQQTLAGLLQTRQALAGARESLAETIFGTQLRTLAPDARIAALRGQESALFGQLATSQDPAAVANRLQAVVLQRIKEEAALRATVQQVTIDGLNQTIALTEQQRRDQLDALRDQIDALQSLKRLAQDIAQFTGEMRFSDLSPLSPEAQLSAARALFEGTLESAQAGDANAQGNLTSNARAYLEEARAYFASSADYAGIFATVLGSLDSLGLTAGAVDPQIAAIEAQAAALQSVQDVLIDTSAEELAALQTIDSALAAREGTLTTAIADQTAAAREQIAELRRTADGQEAQLRQAAARHSEITAEMARINATLTRLLTNTELAGAAP